MSLKTHSGTAEPTCFLKPVSFAGQPAGLLCENVLLQFSGWCRRLLLYQVILTAWFNTKIYWILLNGVAAGSPILDVRSIAKVNTKSTGISLEREKGERAVFKYIRGCCKEEASNLFCVFTGRLRGLNYS